MIKLVDQLLLESLLTEISENTSLYHRSPKKMSVGDIISPRLEGGGLSTKFSELAIEEERKLTAPDAPSRLNCIFSSLIPRSRFVDKGYLYRIKPIGRVFLANSTLIDTIIEKFEREYYDNIGRYDQQERKHYEEDFKKDPSRLMQFLPYEADYYWRGYVPEVSKEGKQALRDIEVLSESAKVLEVVAESEKSTPFVVGDVVEVTDSKKIRAMLTVYFNSKYEKKDEPEANLSKDEMADVLHKIKMSVFDGADPEPSKYSDSTYEFLGFLKKGTKLRVTSLAHSMRGGDGKVGINTGRKYESLMFDFFLDGKEIHRNSKKNDRNITHRFQMYRLNNESIPDVSKFLKRV